MDVLVSLDAGTSSVRAIAWTLEATPVASAARPIAARFPRPGWVEQDPVEILEASLAVLARLGAELAGSDAHVVGVGLANQRETVVAFDTKSGKPLAPAIVWQDRRTQGACRRLEREGVGALVRARTGLVLDPYFSATKMAWLLTEGGVAPSPTLRLGTVDTWLVWNLTGGCDGGALVTEPSNASRTALARLDRPEWDPELLEVFGVSASTLAEIHPSAGTFGPIRHPVVPAPISGRPLAGIAGDQPAALLGHGGVRSGALKCTYGTGSFVLANRSEPPAEPPEGLLVSWAWDLGPGRPRAWALEGSVLSAGAALDWVRDVLGIERPEALETLAAKVSDASGAELVPAFAGLGSPWWDPSARGAVTGIARGVTAAHLARAALDSVVLSVADVVEAMRPALETPPTELSVDGGPSAMDLLVQLQADVCQLPVRRRPPEATARGAALLAGLGVGAIDDLDTLGRLGEAGTTFAPAIGPEQATARREHFHRALERSRHWARSDDETDDPGTGSRPSGGRP